MFSSSPTATARPQRLTQHLLSQNEERELESNSRSFLTCPFVSTRDRRRHTSLLVHNLILDREDRLDVDGSKSCEDDLAKIRATGYQGL